MRSRPLPAGPACLVLLPLVALLAGCGGRAALPDLAPTGLTFDGDNFLEVTIQNQGNGEVPANVGSFFITIDGRSLGGYSLGTLADQSFRDPDGEIVVRTNFKMAGSGRRVGVRVDPNDEITEANEFQNTLTRTLTPPAATGPDFVVADLDVNAAGHLAITVANVGSAASPDALPVRLRVIVNESVAADLTPSLPTLAPAGGATDISPSPAIAITPGDSVRVLVNTNHAGDEIDSTNGVREEILPDGPSFAPYAALLAEPRIEDNIVWTRGGTAVAYPFWTPAERADLRRAILQLERSILERGAPQALTAPPALDASGQFSPSVAWEIYIAHVAQSLWAEVKGGLGWSLLGMTDEELSYLLDSRKLVTHVTPTGNYYFSSWVIGRVTAWSPRVSWEFLTHLGLLEGTQLETVHALTDWMRAHLVHTSSDDDFSALFGYDGAPPADKVLYPLVTSPHKTAGCWGTSGVYGAVLRAANIPVERANIMFRGGTHSRPVFVSVDRSLPHGDDPYTSMVVPSGEPIPVEELFYTQAEMDARFLAPVAIDCDSGTCNTPDEQALHNAGKDHWQAAFDHFSDYPLYEYAVFGPTYLNNSLRGPRIGGGVVEFALPYFTAAERASMVSAAEATLTMIGDGDRAAGERIVIERYSRFAANR